MADRGPTDLDYEIGRRIRERRRLAGLSLAALGRAVGVTYQQIQKYETADDRVPISRLVAIARAVGARPVELIPELVDET